MFHHDSYLNKRPAVDDNSTSESGKRLYDKEKEELICLLEDEVLCCEQIIRSKIAHTNDALYDLHSISFKKDGVTHDTRFVLCDHELCRGNLRKALYKGKRSGAKRAGVDFSICKKHEDRNHFNKAKRLNYLATKWVVKKNLPLDHFESEEAKAFIAELDPKTKNGISRFIIESNLTLRFTPQRSISGIIYDNWLNGREKAIWLSVSNDLGHDSLRDLGDMCADVIKVHPLHKFKYGYKLSDKENGRIQEGVIFGTYASLIGERHQAGATTKRAAQAKLRRMQIMLEKLKKNRAFCVEHQELIPSRNFCQAAASSFDQMKSRISSNPKDAPVELLIADFLHYLSTFKAIIRGDRTKLRFLNLSIYHLYKLDPIYGTNEIDNITVEPSEQRMCTICQEPLIGPSVMTRCEHRYHEQCLMTERKISQACPNCRSNLY